MDSLTIHTSNSTDIFHLFELLIQCKIARRAYLSLAEYSRSVVQRDWEARQSRPMAAIEVMAECTIFLSASAVIAKILFPRDRDQKHQARAESLRLKLGLIELPNLSSTTVRNAFEHIDERIDRVTLEHPNEIICYVHVSCEEPKQSTVLKRFNPLTLSICFLGDTLNLIECSREIEELAVLIPKAMSNESK